ALRIADVIETEPPFHTQALLVRRPVAPADVEQLVILDVIGELAADAAIRANAVYFTVRIFRAHVLFVDNRRGHQRAGRACLHTLATGDASRLTHRIVEVEHDLFQMAAAGHPDDVV